MISITDVKLREYYFGTTNPVEHFPSQRKMVSVLFGDLIEASVVHAKPNRDVGLLDKEDGRTAWGLGRSYETLLHIFVDIVLQCPSSMGILCSSGPMGETSLVPGRWHDCMLDVEAVRQLLFYRRGLGTHDIPIVLTTSWGWC